MIYFRDALVFLRLAQKVKALNTVNAHGSGITSGASPGLGKNSSGINNSMLNSLMSVSPWRKIWAGGAEMFFLDVGALQ
jgi:hypothetical protein